MFTYSSILTRKIKHVLLKIVVDLSGICVSFSLKICSILNACYMVLYVLLKIFLPSFYLCFITEKRGTKGKCVLLMHHNILRSIILWEYLYGENIN